MRSLLKNRPCDGCIPLTIAVAFSCLIHDSFGFSKASTIAPINPRNVCFLHDYETVRGPHFQALFDQVMQQMEGGDDNKRVLIFRGGDESEGTAHSMSMANEGAACQEELLRNDLNLDACETVQLQDHNPMTLEDKIKQFQPNVLWVGSAHGNSFLLRYQTRTSGLDEITARLCGPPSNRRTSPGVLFVGEGAGSVCGGADMAIGYANGDDASAAPEPQFRGMELLGDQSSIFFGNADAIVGNPRFPGCTSVDAMKAQESINVLTPEQVYVWSQNHDDVTSFVMHMGRKGMIEGMQSPRPLVPLFEDDNAAGGRKCQGEPSIDPSRSMQSIGDSEWFEEWDG